jgi:serine/threonine protein kinase
MDYYLPGHEVGQGKSIVELLRANGHRAIYKVKDAEEKLFALKVCHRGDLPAEEHRSNAVRLEREYMALHGFRGLPCFPFVYDLAVHEGNPQMLMEFLQGVPFSAFLAQRPALLKALRAFQGLCEIVALLHDQGLCHRDLKPSNILLRSDEMLPVLLDFGACQPLLYDTLTGPGEIVGTPLYLSPEYAAYILGPRQRGHRVAQPTADVYSLGVILYEVLTGMRPIWTRGGLGELLREVCDRVPMHPCDVRLEARVPRPLGDFAMRLLEKNPENRPQTAVRVGLELAEILKDVERELWNRTPPRFAEPTEIPVRLAPLEAMPSKSDGAPVLRPPRPSTASHVVVGLLVIAVVSLVGQVTSTVLLFTSALRDWERLHTRAQVVGGPLLAEQDQPKGGSAKSIPPTPPKGHARPPCDVEVGEKEINGACWLPLDVPQCTGRMYTHQGKCYLSVKRGPGVVFDP